MQSLFINVVEECRDRVTRWHVWMHWLKRWVTWFDRGFHHWTKAPGTCSWR